MVYIGIIGPGLVGSALISQLKTHSDSNSTHAFSVVAIINSKKLSLSDPSISNSTISLSNWKDQLETSPHRASLDQFIQHLIRYKNSVIVDCTSSDSIAHLYPNWLKQGLHIVTPNKKAFSGSEELWKNIKSLTEKKREKKSPLIYHEATVGYCTLINNCYH